MSLEATAVGGASGEVRPPVEEAAAEVAAELELSEVPAERVVRGGWLMASALPVARAVEVDQDAMVVKEGVAEAGATRQRAAQAVQAALAVTPIASDSEGRTNIGMMLVLNIFL